MQQSASPSSVAADAAMARVFLVGQNKLLREGLAKVLQKKGKLKVVGSQSLSAQTADDVLASVPDVLVVDPFTASTCNFESLRRALRQLPRLGVVMIGMEADEHQFLEAVRDGITGYVLNDESAMDVVVAVRAVAEGGVVCPPSLCRTLFRWVTEQGSAGLQSTPQRSSVPARS